MFKIGEKISYGMHGVMEIVDIRQEDATPGSPTYYVLSAQGEGTSLTFVPVDSEMLVSQMHRLPSKEEVFELLRKAKSSSPIAWIDDNRKRTEYFKKIIRSADKCAIISMINAIYLAGLERQKEGKKNYLSDENLMHKAEKLINSELSAVLGIPEDSVPRFIANFEG